MYEQQNIQYVVHKLVKHETMGLEIGLFADENARNFYIELKTLITECFESLYSLVKRQYAPKVHQFRFMRGLEIFNNNNAQAGTEMARALSMFPTMKEEYQTAMIRYTHLLYGTMVGTLSLHILPLKTFLFRLYQRISKTQEISSLRYFTMTYLEQDIFLKDVVRLVMKDCMSTHTNARQPQPNGKGTGTGTPVDGAFAFPYYHQQQQHIQPSDSVSNIQPSSSDQRHERPESPSKSKSKSKLKSKSSRRSTNHKSNSSGKSRTSSHYRHKSRTKQRSKSRNASQLSGAHHKRNSKPQTLDSHEKNRGFSIYSDGDNGRGYGNKRHDAINDSGSSIIARSTLERNNRGAAEAGAVAHLPQDAPSVFLSSRRPRLADSGMRIIDTGNASSAGRNPVSKVSDDSESQSTSSSA